MSHASALPNIISANTDETVAEQPALEQVLQTTLDVYDLLKRFHQTLQQTVHYHSFHFRNTETGHSLSIGTAQEQAAYFELTLNNQSLGECRFTKPTAFSNQEFSRIENALTQLLYPLRNAISYHMVVMHSVTCPLTKLSNRSQFDQTIRREIDLATRHQGTFAVLLLDVDNFKQINDTYGHLAGDRILREMGALFQDFKRQSDYVFRFGGEEFVYILSQSTLNGAHLVAERIRQQIAHHVFHFQSHIIPVTVSIGLTQFQAGDHFETLFQRVDKALYRAKENGKNQVCLTSPHS